MRSCDKAGENMLFPNGFSGMFFNFGPKGKLLLKEVYSTPEVSIFGQIDRHFIAMHWPGFYSLGVLMRPTVLSRFLRSDMSELTNRICDGSLIRKDLSELREEIEKAPIVEHKIRCIELYLLKVFSQTSNTKSIADQALHLIHETGAPSIEKLAKNLRVSQRYLELNFKKQVGLSPKTYSLILRFNKVEQQLRAMPKLGWNQMDFANDYHDQNHFIKDFKRFTGHTPSDYLLNNFEMGRSYLIR